MQFWANALVLAAMLWVCGCERREEARVAAPSNPPAPAAASSGEEPATVQYHLNRAQSKLRTIKVWLGPHEIEAEVAVTLTEISTGMMFRTNLAEKAGMLFVFAGERPREFYMKNCVIDLSAAYITGEGVIDEVIQLQAGVVKGVPSRSDRIKYVLEMPKGWFERNRVGPGMVVNTSEGPLKNLRGILP